MEVTIEEMHLLIEALEAELSRARQAGGATRVTELEVALQDMKVQRARMLVAAGNAAAANIASHAAKVEAIVARLTNPKTLLSLRPIADQIGIALPAVSGDADLADLVENFPVKPPSESQNDPEPATGDKPSRFIAARMVAAKTILYTDAEGRDFIRSGGSRSWRNFNPGNIRKGDFAISMGSIGDDGSFAIFPDKATGRDAIVGLLRGNSYRHLTLEKGIARYAPPQENNTTRYVDFVTGQTGIVPDAVLGDLLIADVRKVAGAIEKMEGWTLGDERPHAPASGTIGAAAAVGGTGGVSAAIGAAAEWMEVALREAALPFAERSEIAGLASNPRIINYFRVAAAWFEPGGDETDWCAAFVNYCLETSGYVGTNHPGARSFFWNKKNQFVRLDGPRKHTIAVRRYAPFTDQAWSTGKGHVGFVTGYTDTHVTLLGGNQGRTINEKSFPRKHTDATGNTTAEFVAFLMPVMN
jgi:uncharacterized protein (TIGR02594 family)